MEKNNGFQYKQSGNRFMDSSIYFILRLPIKNRFAVFAQLSDNGFGLGLGRGGLEMKDFQLISGRSESEVKSKARVLAKQGWREAPENNGSPSTSVMWKEVNGERKYYLGVVR